MLMWGGLTQLPLLYLHSQPRHKQESKLAPRFTGVYLGVGREARRPGPYTWLLEREDSAWFPQILSGQSWPGRQ